MHFLRSHISTKSQRFTVSQGHLDLISRDPPSLKLATSRAIGEEMTQVTSPFASGQTKILSIKPVLCPITQSHSPHVEISVHRQMKCAVTFVHYMCWRRSTM